MSEFPRQIPQGSRFGVIVRAMARLLPAAAVGIAIVAAGDAARMADQAHRFLDGPVDVVALALMVAGLHLWTAAWLVLAGGLVLALVSDGDPDGLLDRARSGLLRAVRGTSVRVGSRTVAVALATVFFFGVLALAVTRLADTVNTPILLGLAAAGIGVASLAIATVIAVIVAALLERLGRLPVIRHVLAARTVTVAGLLLALAGMTGAAAFERTIFKSIDGWRLYLPALSLTAALGLLVLWRPAGPGARRRFVPWALAVVVVAVVALGLLWAGNREGARALFLSFGRNGAQAAKVWERVFDFDGDGASTFMGGRDCAPRDPRIYPGAPEIPDNGIDEDCQDGDLRTAPPRLKRPRLTHPVAGLKHPDILLISIDGCRRDALGTYGAPPDRTPRLDRLAETAVVFDDAIAPASWTMPAFAAILTGRFAGEIPGFHGASRIRAVPDDIPLLFEPFVKAGYRVAAVTAGLQLDRLGLDRGIDDWRSISPGPRGRFAGPVADLAIDLLAEAKKDQPLFLWVHLIDPHYPYDPPAAHRRFGGDRRGLYAGEVAYSDDAVGRVLDALRDAGRDERTVVAFFSDHGEAFREHGQRFHGESVYAEEVRVPLMIRVPGIPPGRRGDLVSTLDLGPTLWDLAGLPTALPGRGVTLASLVAGTRRAPPHRYVFSEQTRSTQEFALTSPDHRLRYDRTLHRYELFDRAADPDEQRDVSRTLRHVARTMRRELARTMAAIDAVAFREMEEVLVREVPEGFSPVEDAFAGGPELVAFQVERAERKVKVELVLRSRGPMEDEGKVEVRLDLRGPDDANLGSGRREVGGGTYAPARWKQGDLIRHHGEVSSRQDLPGGSRVCVSLIVDQTPLVMRSGDIRRCFDLP